MASSHSLSGVCYVIHVQVIRYVYWWTCTCVYIDICTQCVYVLVLPCLLFLIHSRAQERFLLQPAHWKGDWLLRVRCPEGRRQNKLPRTVIMVRNPAPDVYIIIHKHIIHNDNIMCALLEYSLYNCIYNTHVHVHHVHVCVLCTCSSVFHCLFLLVQYT